MDPTPGKKILWFVTLLGRVGLSLQILLQAPQKNPIDLFD